MVTTALCPRGTAPPAGRATSPAPVGAATAAPDPLDWKLKLTSVREMFAGTFTLRLLILIENVPGRLARFLKYRPGTTTVLPFTVA